MSLMGYADIAADADRGLGAVLARTDTAPGVSLGNAYLGRTTTDVLAHLHAWHRLFLGWLDEHGRGETVAYPARGFTWRDLDSLNEQIYQRHRETPYSVMVDLLRASHREVLDTLRALPEVAVLSPDAFDWLGGEALGSVAHECLGAHYAWALEMLDAAGLTAE